MVDRVSGLVSGMDVDSLVAKMMKARRAPVDKMVQTKQTLQWQRDAFRDMNTKIYDFRNTKLSNYKLEATFGAKGVTVSGNSEAVSAKAGAAANGTLNIQVNKLAKAATNYSSSDIRTADKSFDPTKALDTQSAKLDSYSSSNKSFKINGVEVTFDPSKESLDDVLKKINQKTNVNAFYDSASGRVSLISKDTGLVNKAGGGEHIQLEGAFLNDTLQMATSVNPANAASNAEVSINGMPATSDYKSNVITVNGVEVTLLKAGGAAANLAVKTDTSKVIDSVKAFIKDYNDMLKSLNDKVNETRYRDYTPLTEAQKEKMKDNDVTLWEAKAKSGLLKNDEVLTKAISSLRSDATAQVDTGSAKYKTLASIGIVTGDYSERGKLYLADESKLKAAIETEPDAVRALFTANGTNANKTDVGIAKRMYDHMEVTLKDITKKAGNASYADSTSKDSSFLGTQLYTIGKRIDAANDRLSTLENQYYARFSAMETAISKYNAQSASLSKQFG